MLRLGDYNTLTVVKTVDFGLYLDGGQAGEILLPTRYIPEGTEVGDRLEVFIYLDQEERIIATTERPLAKVGDFAFLEVQWVNSSGAFLGWGLMKDVFCPFREQKRKMEKGQRHMVHIHVDPETYRIMASAKIEHFLSKEPCDLKPGQEVDIIVWQRTELGYKAIIENRWAGLVYQDQIFTPIHPGLKTKAYIHAIRPDGKIDLTLQPTGRRQTLDFATTLLEYMRAHAGECPFGDKSEADAIYSEFHVSKKVFKKAVGDLYKRRLIDVSPTSLRLL